MNLQRLRHFVAVVETGSLSRAAQAVHLSQPALSKSVAKLEEELGMRLFSRAGALKLTALGRETYDRVRSFVDASGDLGRDLALLRSGEIGELRVGCGPIMAESLLGPAVGRLLHAQPLLKVTSQVAAVSHLEQMLRQRRLDLLIGDLGQLESLRDFEVIPFLPLDIVWFGRKGHPLAGPQRVAPDRFLGFPIVAPTLPQWAQAWFDDLLPAADRPFRLSFECSHYPSLMDVIQTTDAISGATSIAIAKDLEAGRADMINLDAPTLQSNTGAVFLKARQLSPPAEALIRELTAQMDHQTDTGGRSTKKAPTPKRT